MFIGLEKQSQVLKQLHIIKAVAYVLPSFTAGFGGLKTGFSQT